MKEGTRIFTTGQVAKMLEVAPKTVANWVDSGRLQGFRIPSSQDRRITREALITFLKENKMPLGILEEQSTTIVVVGDEKMEKVCTALLGAPIGWNVLRVESFFQAGLAVPQGAQSVLLVKPDQPGIDAVIETTRNLPVLMVAIRQKGDKPRGKPVGFDGICFVQEPKTIAPQVQSLLARKAR